LRAGCIVQRCDGRVEYVPGPGSAGVRFLDL